MAARERRDLSAERRTEILEAFKRCIGERGLERSSMRRVAEEAGVSQPLLMHHFGSRAGLVEALVQHVLAEYDGTLARSLVSVAEGDDSEALLEYLYGGRFTEIAERADGLFPELHAAAARDETTRDLLRDLYARFQRGLAGTLRKTFPEASPAECRRVAYGLVCLAESNELLRELGLPGRRSRDAVELGRALLDSLDPGPRR